MKKTILFLMNGFGVEQANSYSIYSKDLMPNLDYYTKEYLFAPIESKALDISNSYLYFSTLTKCSLTYSLMDKVVENFDNYKNFGSYINTIKDNSKIQLFCYIENDQILIHLRSFINYIRTKKNNPIFVHAILNSKDIENYKEVERIINRIHYDFQDCKVATIIGEKSLKEPNLNSYLNMLQNEIGERWKELNKKINSLYNQKIAPNNCKEFCMDEGFKVQNNDNLFFFNYDASDMSNFITNLTKICDTNMTFSLFPIRGIKYPLLAFPKSGKSLVNTLEKLNAKGLILSSSHEMRVINYYCNGLQDVANENLSYIKTDNNFLDNIDNIKAVLDDKFDLIIINYSIDYCNNVTQIKEKLGKLDAILKNVVDHCKMKEYSLFISSLYGIKKEMAVDNYTKSLVNFSPKVPFIVVDPYFNKTNFRIDYGDIHSLAHTVFTNMNNKYDGGAVLIKKKGYLGKLIKK